MLIFLKMRESVYLIFFTKCPQTVYLSVSQELILGIYQGVPSPIYPENSPQRTVKGFLKEFLQNFQK